ncbi:hypothetical protein BGZ65_004710, partial [Modicella reniformis]
MPFPTTSADLMASAMGGSLLSTSSASNASTNSPVPASSSAVPSSKTKKELASSSGHGTIRLFFSLKENPNAIISYADLIRQEQKRQRMAQLQASSSSRIGGNASGPSALSTPTKNLSVKEAGATQSSTGAMDVDPPEGEEALGEADSEAEDDEDDDDDEEENEEGTEAEDEDDEDDPDDDDDRDDDPEPGRREPKDFLDALTEKYAGLEEGNEGEDEDEEEDEDGKEQVYKRPSRWDTEHYDIEDEFIDDSEMMLEAIGMVRPKVDGFFAYRGPVETTNEDPDSSDAGLRSKRPSKRKSAVGSSPLSTVKSSSKSSKGASNLAVTENANDSTSEMSEMDDKPKASKSSSASLGLANSSTTPSDNPATSGPAESGANSATTTPTKKKTAPSKSKAAAKDISKEGAEANKDSDKDSKSGTSKKAKAKPSKTTVAASATAAVSTPIVRVDSPPPSDVSPDSAIPPSVPSRPSSPSKSKSKPKASTTNESDQTSTGNSSGNMEASTTATESVPSEAITTTEPVKAPATESTTKASEGSTKAKTAKTLEPLNEDVQKAYNIVADLARKETWEVKARFPPHIKAPLFDCARVALTTRSSGYMLEDNFFFHLQLVLPYNKFTLKKLIYKNVLPGWIADLEAQKTRLIEQFKTRANTVWKTSGLGDQPDRDGDGDVNMNEEGKPPKKFPWTQDLRLLLWETMEKFMEILAAKQEFRTIDENQPLPFSDAKTRKDAYQTLLQSFPAGCMTSYEISRQYSQLKEKVQKQEKKETESSSSSMPAGKPRPVFSGSGGSKSGSTSTTVRSTNTQSSGTVASRPQPAATSITVTPTLAPATASVPALTPAPLLAPQATPTATTSPLASVPAAGSHVPSGEVPRDHSHRSSPSKSPSIVHRTAHLSEIVHPTPQQPRAQQAAFMGEPVVGNGSSVANKKRKKSEE